MGSAGHGELSRSALRVRWLAERWFGGRKGEVGGGWGWGWVSGLGS
jgi:hypothetical protein